MGRLFAEHVTLSGGWIPKVFEIWATHYSYSYFDNHGSAVWVCHAFSLA